MSVNDVEEEKARCTVFSRHSMASELFDFEIFCVFFPVLPMNRRFHRTSHGLVSELNI